MLNFVHLRVFRGQNVCFRCPKLLAVKESLESRLRVETTGAAKYFDFLTIFTGRIRLSWNGRCPNSSETHEH